MPPKVPENTRHYLFTGFFPQIFLIILFMLIFRFWGWANDLLFAISLTYMIKHFLRGIYAPGHARALGYMYQGKWKEAISLLIKNKQHFELHPKIDTYRSITLLSASAISYHEMACTNLAYCFAKMGEWENALHYYQETLTVNPQNENAKRGINYLQSQQLRLSIQNNFSETKKVAPTD